jgi:hypothetical protein
MRGVYENYDVTLQPDAVFNYCFDEAGPEIVCRKSKEPDELVPGHSGSLGTLS